MQTKFHSILEISANTFTGFIISLTYQWYVANPQLGENEISFFTTSSVVLQFTVISLLRSYIWRRVGDYFTRRRMEKLHSTWLSTHTDWEN